MYKIFSLLLALTLTGCATTVKFDVIKPSEVNMSSSRTLIMEEIGYEDDKTGNIFNIITTILDPSSYISNRDKIERRVLDYAEFKLEKTLMDTNYFTVVNEQEAIPGYRNLDKASQVKSLRDFGVQGIFKADITSLDIQGNEEIRTESVYNSDTEEYEDIRVKFYSYEVYFSLVFKVISTENGATIATGSYSETAYEEQLYNDRYQINITSLFEDCIDKIMVQLSRQIAPYRVSEIRYLIKDETKDPELKRANELVKKGGYKEAYKIYINNWKSTNNPAAGYNGAILLEAEGDITGAITLMEDVYNTTGNSKAASDLRRLKRVLSDNEELEKQMN